MAEGSGKSRLRALLNKFEPAKEEPPPPPRKERFQSTLDSPAPTLSAEAKSARVQSIRATKDEPKSHRRSIPQIGPTDTDEERDLKRQIQAKEQEILDVASKITALCDRLDRVLDTFNASVVGTAPEAEAASSDKRTKAFDATENKSETGEITSRKSAPSSGTSLEAILAAARGGTPRAKSETPKYAKLLRDLK